MLLFLGQEAKFVDAVEDLTDFVFDGVRAGGLCFETVQVRKELAIDEAD